MVKKNTDITGFEIKKLPTIRPEESFQDSRYQTIGGFYKQKRKEILDRKFNKSKRRINRLIKSIGDV